MNDRGAASICTRIFQSFRAASTGGSCSAVVPGTSRWHGWARQGRSSPSGLFAPWLKGISSRKPQVAESRSGAPPEPVLRRDNSDGTEENQHHDQQRSRVEAVGAKNLNRENEVGEDQQGQRKASMEVPHSVLQAGSALVFDFAPRRGIRAGRLAAAGVTGRGGRAIGYDPLTGSEKTGKRCWSSGHLQVSLSGR